MKQPEPETQVSRRQLLRCVVSRSGLTGSEPLVVIAPHCLALNDVACRNCDDSCEQRAIRFRPRMGGQYIPTILNDACTACGDCIAVCPVNALSIAGGHSNV